MKTITWLVGSASDCDIIIHDKQVAPHHARLTKQSDGFHYLKDLDSEHGTFVEGVRITEACRVTPRDNIKIGPQAALEWPQAPPVESPAPVPAASTSAEPARRNPVLLAVGGLALLAVGAALGAWLVPQFWPTEAVQAAEGDEASESGPAEERSFEGFKMGTLPANDPIKTIKVTIDVDENGEPLNELVDLHLGFGFPLRLYPVGSDSRGPTFAAFPQNSSLEPGENTVDAGSSAWFEFSSSSEEAGLDELQTTTTLLSDLTVADVHNIGIASRGRGNWILSGYKIEINGTLYASNDAIYASAEEIQSQNEVEMLSRQAEIDALEDQLKDLREIVETGLASDSDEAALEVGEADLSLLKDQLITNVGLVSGYYPWFEESDAEFKPSSSSEETVKSVVVTLVTAPEKHSGTGNSLYLISGPKKHLLSAVPNALSDDPQQEQKFKIDPVALKYDPISTKQIDEFAIGMLGTDVPFAQVPDRAKLQRVSVEVDGEVAYNSEQKEVDRKTLSTIQLLPPVHRDDLGAVVKNSESARQKFQWKPGMVIEELAANDSNEVEEEPDQETSDQIGKANEIDNGKILPPNRNPNQAPNVFVIMSPSGRASTPPWWSGFGGRGGTPSSLLPIRFLKPPPQQPPVITNVRIATTGLLQDKQPVLVTWNVSGNTSQISYFQVTLKPVLPHSGGVFGDDLVINSNPLPRVSASLRQATLTIDLSKFTGLSAQRKYLYLEPQVTAFNAQGKTINRVAAKGPIVPVSPLPPAGSGTGSQPIALVNGPLPLQQRFFNRRNQFGPAGCPGFQISGDCFGDTGPATAAQDSFNVWRPYSAGNTGLGNSAWRLTAPITQTSFPLRIVNFGPNVGTSSWGTPVNPTGDVGFPAAVPPDWIVIRYDSPGPVNITSDMHFVAHLGFINGPATLNNSAAVYTSVVVSDPTFRPRPPLLNGVQPNEVLRIETTNGPLVSYSKQTGGRNNPLQLIDIPIQVGKTASQISGAISQAQTNAGIPNTTSPAQVIVPAGTTATPTTMSRAYVSVTIAIKQTSANGSEGVGIFGARLVPGP